MTKPHVCMNCDRELPDRQPCDRRLCEPCARLYYRLHRWKGRAVRAEAIVRSVNAVIGGAEAWPLRPEDGPGRSRKS